MVAIERNVALLAEVSENPGVIFEEIAHQYNVTPRAVVEALPEAMRRFPPGDKFIEAMNDVAEWGHAQVIVHTEDGIMETAGPIPKDSVTRGHFNLMGRAGFRGYLK